MLRANEIPCAEAVRLLLRFESKCIDVRSEGEFLDGSIPASVNFPILNNEERHLVGISYKQEGPEQAVKLGHRLVEPQREARIQAWCNHLKDAEWPLVNCWRGGMRSQIAVDWIAAAGGRALRVSGGYKAMRREILGSLDRLPSLLVIAGPTGSQKTRLLGAAPHLNLEMHAKHRGSAFGQFLTEPQPTQANFENGIGLELLRQRAGRLLVEDESMMIGQIHLPVPLREKMNESPVVRIRMNVEQRAENILREYIREPLHGGFSAEALHSRFRESICRVEKKLGGLLAQQVQGRMALAFARGSEELHKEWINELLVHYYDNAYAYSFARANRQIAFEGDWNECHHWIQKQFA